MRKRLPRSLAAIALVPALAGCASSSVLGMESMMRPTPASGTTAGVVAAQDRIELTGRFVKFTGFPCHRSDPYIGNETVVFVGSDGSRTAIVTGSANWIGLGRPQARRSGSVGRWPRSRPSCPWPTDMSS